MSVYKNIFSYYFTWKLNYNLTYKMRIANLKYVYLIIYHYP